MFIRVLLLPVLLVLLVIPASAWESRVAPANSAYYLYGGGGCSTVTKSISVLGNYKVSRCTDNATSVLKFDVSFPSRAKALWYLKIAYEIPNSESGKCVFKVSSCAHRDGDSSTCFAGTTLSIDPGALPNPKDNTKFYETQNFPVNSLIIEKMNATDCVDGECNNLVVTFTIQIDDVNTTHTVCDVRALEYAFDFL